MNRYRRPEDTVSGEKEADAFLKKLGCVVSGSSAPQFTTLTCNRRSGTS